MPQPVNPSHPAPKPNATVAQKLKDYLDLIRWNRPAGWLLLLWPTLAALWLAAGGFPGWHLLIVFCVGTVLMRSAGCCINDIADREFDKHVKRTVNRPITSGRISVREAIAVGVVLALVAFALVLTTNALTIAWSFVAVAVTIFYPYAKRFFSMPQAVLGIAFSIGIPMAFTAIQNQVPSVVWWLLLSNLCWTIAYDTEYAMVDRDDDLKIGMKTSAITLGKWDVSAVTALYIAALILWLVAVQPYALGWPKWLALGAAAAQVLWHWSLIRARSRDDCFKAFRLNHWLGFTLFAGVALGLQLA